MLFLYNRPGFYAYLGKVYDYINKYNHIICIAVKYHKQTDIFM